MILRAVAMLLAVAAGWFVLAPASLGGQVSLVTTHGASMLPEFHTGDLAVVVRGDGEYQAGEVIAYRSAVLRDVVLHRVVAEHGGHYVTKGDNNAWLDPDRPAAEDVLGSLLLRIPKVGYLAQATRTPLFWTVVIAAFALAAVATGTKRKKRPLMTNHPHWIAVRRRKTIARIAAGAAVVAGLLSLAGFVVPMATTPAAAASSGAGAVAWTYTATVPQSVTYPDGRLTTGEPVFLQLVDGLTVRATDPETGPLSADTLTARVRTGSGWEADVPLTAHRAGARIDLGALTATLAKVAAETGVTPGDTTLTVTARDGASLRLTHDGTQLHADSAALATSTPAPSDARQDQPLLATVVGPLHSVRWLTSAIAAVAAVAAWLLLRRHRAATPQVPSRAVSAEDISVPADRVVVDLADMAALRTIARRVDRPMIHHRTGHRAALVVDDGDTVYRYAQAETSN